MSANPPCAQSLSWPLRCLRSVVLAGLALAVAGLSGPLAQAQVPKPAPKPATKPATKPAAKPATKPAAKPAAKPAPPPEVKGDYIEMPADESLKKLRSEAIKALREGTLPQAVSDYYTKYAIPRWTLIANRAEVRDYRNQFGNELKVGKDPAHDQLVALVLPILTTMAQKNYHPVARVNAMLMIGELNADEAARPSDNPTPLPEAMPLLSSAAASDTMPDAVRVAAILGIKRHAELGSTMLPANQTAAVGALVGVVSLKSGAGRSAAGHAWMRALAIDTLGAIKSPGANGQVANVLLGIMGEATAPFSVRCAAARALGKLTYTEDAGLNRAATVREMGQLAVAVSKDELQRQADEEGSFSRRRVQSRLIAIYLGLAGLTPYMSDQADAALHTAVATEVRKCLETLENKKIEDAEAIPQFSQEVDALSGKLLAPAAKPAAKPE